ncbi:hypothetical protein DTL42_11500 [Bremerella cremea]|uniref:DUF4064 domain-containing protein n=1 Tax=Bremerella cremea TaxID=1031537 RepID=A0A368KQS7_9BACT|nr:hypothetical protein [Bremerella cremea]RCS49161.1 hypothetical protein DTL42_11500 [Bremerella cremea]
MSNFEDDPFRSPADNPAGYEGREQPRDDEHGLIVAVAVINYIFGSLCLMCGVCSGVLGGSVLGIIFAAIGNDPQFGPDAKMGMGIASMAVVLLAVIQVLIGLLVLLAGYGVQCFREWGRILTVVLGIISGLVGLLALSSLNIFGLLQIGYAIFVLVVLLNPRYTRNFR